MLQVAIIGGGFAGLAAARELARDGAFDVCRVDRRFGSDFLPLLPAVAGGVIRPEHAGAPLAEQCGVALGVPVSGVAAAFLNYVMCAYRSASMRNAMGVLRDARLACGRRPAAPP